MKFFYTRDYHPFAKSSDEYVSRGIINVVERNQFGTLHNIGRVGIEIVDYTRVFKEGRVTLFDVCDTYCGGWPYLYSLIFDNDTGDVLEEVTQLGSFDFIALITRVELLSPAIKAEETILFHVAYLNGCATLSCMWRHFTGLSASKLSSLGFCKIAGSELLLLNTSLPGNCFEFTTPQIETNLDPKRDYSAELEEIWSRSI